MQKIGWGVFCAVALAAVAADVEIAGVEIWKMMLAAVGLVLIIWGNRLRS